MQITKRLFSILFFISLCFGLQAQKLLPIKQDGKWGAIDESGKIIIEAQYDFIGSFVSVKRLDAAKTQWATYRKDGTVGIINAKGSIIVENQYQQIRIFKNQTAAVWKAGKCGLINAEGKEIVAPEYDHIDPLNTQLFRMVFKKKLGITDPQGKVIHAAIFDKIEPFKQGYEFTTVQQGNKLGLLDMYGKLVLPVEYDKIELEMFSMKGYKGKSITSMRTSEGAKIEHMQTYTNQTAYDLAKKQENLASKKAHLSKNPEANKPQWIKDEFRYKLVDFFGRNLLGKEFFSVNVDDETNLSLGILENEQKELECYLIAHQQAKILMKKTAKDLVLSDFRTSNYARISLDTLWDGLVNKSGEIIDKIQGQAITNIGNFNDKRAYVHINNKFGFIDENAKLVIPLDYDIVSGFEGGYAIAKKEGKFGCLNPTGSAAIPIIYDGIGQPAFGVVRVKKGRGRSGKWALFSMNNKSLTEFIYDTIGEFENGEAVVRKNGKWGVIDLQGKEVVAPSIQCSRLFAFNKGVAKIGNELIVENIAGAPKRRYKYNGYVNREGQEVVAPNYDYIFDFDSVWQAKKGVARVVKGKFVGYLDATGKEVVAPKYVGIQDFEKVWTQQKGLAKIINPDGKFGYINHFGKLILNPAFSSVENFEAVLADTNQWARASDSGKFGYINHKGETKISFVYDLISEFKNGAAIVKKDGKYGLISKENQLLIPIEYDGIRYLQGSNQQLLKVYKKKPTIYTLDQQGNVSNSAPYTEEKNTADTGIKLPKYKYLTPFDKNGLAVIEVNKLKGIANVQGKVIIKPKYRQLNAFSEGFASFQQDSKDRTKRKWGYINLQGKETITASFNQATPFNNGKAAVLKGMWGYINAQGKLIIPHKYRKASTFSDGLAIVNETIIINDKGTQVGTLSLAGTVTKGFQAGRAVLSTTTGELHINQEGLPAYYSKFDEASNFIGDIAFVKRGEVWELTRKMNANESKVRFNSAQRNAYLAKFGNRYKRKTPFGTLQDVKWEKVKDGFWRMIDKNGNFINESVYDALISDENTFQVRKDGFFGIANLKGEFITPAENEIIQAVNPQIIRVELGGKIGYLRPNGSWIWELK